MTGWWFGTFFIFHFIYGIILPIDFHIFQDGYCTTNRMRIPHQYPIQSAVFMVKNPGVRCRNQALSQAQVRPGAGPLKGLRKR